MPSDLIRGWRPVRVKKTRQNKNLEPRFDSIETEKALVIDIILRASEQMDDAGRCDGDEHEA